VADHEALLKLLEWRMGLAGPDADPPDSREIRDWLWLSAQLDGVQLPWQYTNKVRTTKASEEDQPSHPDTTHASTPASSQDPRPEVRAPAPPDPHLATPFPPDPPAPEAAADPVARLLADNLLPDDAEVAEALQRRQRGVPLRVRQLALLPYPLQILQALRPLLRRRPHPHWRVLDEERSAAKSAEMGLAWPVFRPRRVPMVALRLVLDGGLSMAVWEPLAQELQRVLASSQAFHRVDLQRLTPPHLPTHQPATGANDGTTVILLLSDTAGRHWWDGSILPWLQTMANQQPLVVLHTLPLRYWESTALQRAPALTLKNCEPLAANNRYQPLLPLRDPWDDPGSTDSLPPAGGTCLPVISLDRRELGPWAALVMGEAWARCAGRVLPVAEPQLLGRDEQPTPATTEINDEEAERLWQEFAQRASPEARELMLSMAASLFLTLPVLRLLQAVVAPQAFAPQPLAEVLVSGLVRRLPGQETVAATPDRLQFELVPALRRLLEPRLSPQRRRQVLAAVTDLLERHWDRQGSGSSFRALLLGPKEVLERDQPDLFHIANVTAAMLDQLPGRQFRELASQLRGRKPVAPAPVWPASMVFSDLEYESAQLLPIPESEAISFGTARYLEQELRLINYETASLTRVVKLNNRGKTRPSALDVFTDREELIAAFERNLAHKKPEEHRVLVFYGDGGIGKTTLLQKLEQLHRQRCPQALMGRLDLAGADTTPPDLLLYRLRRLFPTIPFPSFSLALAEYGRRFHPEQVYGSDRKELLQGAGPYADVLAGGLEVLGQLSGVGLAVSTMKAAATAQRQLSDWVQRRAEPWLQRSQSLSEEQMLAQLPLQWAKDFRQALSSQLDQGWDDAITYNGPLPMIALDTYETLWHSGMGKSGRRREPRERWLVDLVSELPEVLWVIGGRDRLSWEEGYDQAWSEACEQHLIGQLSDEDARSFLAKRGIKEPAIVEKILDKAAGVPFYLELETQLYDKTPADERTPEVFGGSQQGQIDRLLTSPVASERATLMLIPTVEIHRSKATAWAFHESLQRDVRSPGATVEAAVPLSLTFVEIPAGIFLMGSPPEEPERLDDEGPQHEVKLASFFMSQTPITQAQWREVAQWQERPGERWERELDPEPSFFQPRRNPKARSFDDARFSLLKGETDSEQRPVENVNWLDAIEFCSRLSQRTGRTYTLPSEAQWEYACRAGTTTAFHFGATIMPELANYNGNYVYAEGSKGEYRKQTTPVGIFPANAWGLHEMHGNVLEWCLDPWHDSYKGAPADGTAWLNTAESNNKQTIEKGNKSDSEQQQKLLRGGSWYDDPRNCRSASRDHYRPDNASVDVGFRVVCLPQGPSLNS
jgi:formylglycine-generating enzyme required for sulfatase activity